MSTSDPEFPPAHDRHDPPFVAGERQMLEAWLDFHRATLLMKCEDLDAEQLRTRSAPPSSLSLLGLVRHMTDVERSWFRNVLDDEGLPSVYSTEANEDADFDDLDSTEPDKVFAAYRSMVDTCRATAARHPDLDSVARRRRRGNDVSLRWIYLHMIEEYARHNGHADLLRERIDGRTGD